MSYVQKTKRQPYLTLSNLKTFRESTGHTEIYRGIIKSNEKFKRRINPQKRYSHKQHYQIIRLSQLEFTLAATEEIPTLKKTNQKITIVGETQAREGFTFIHRGGTDKCAECRFHRVCIENLEPNRVYEVVGIREREIPCIVHESGARVVEVAEPLIRMAIPSKEGFEGSVFTFTSKECDKLDCDKRDLCYPLGIRSGDRCKIIKVVEKIECDLESSPLAIILLRRIAQ